MTWALLAAAALFGPRHPPAEIRAVDAAGRGVPLVELETVHGVRLVTDNAGRAAFLEPGLIGRETWLTVRGHGYEVPADGFGYRGVRITPDPARPAVIRVNRTLPAERLCRLIGAGRWRDSAALGYAVPPPLNGRVAGQDSVQAAVYKNRVFWFWGDTARLDRPLGLFRTAGATTPMPAPADDLSTGLPYDYFTGPDGFARATVPLPDRPEGVVWIDGLCVVPDETGTDRLVCHYSRRAGLAKQLDHGLAVWDDGAAEFRSVETLPADETWRRPRTHPIDYAENGRRWLLFGSPTPNVRVPATLAAVRDPSRYEAFTCVAADGSPPAAGAPPAWRWQTDFPPVDSATERGWIDENRIDPRHARFCPADAADPIARVTLHSGTVRRNAFRGKWILIAGRIGGETSHLGEVWYAEADGPVGPFAAAVKIAEHDRQSFYNVCQHPFLDRDGGRTVHFEGTFDNAFSGNPDRVPRYDYNQLLYRLDLTDPRLEPARVTDSAEP